MVEIKKYNPEWVSDFKLLKDNYEDSIKDVEVSVEHVGSTSVEGLCAKPVIDIVIIYYREDDFKSIKSSLENIGYIHRGDLGITNREAFRYTGKDKLPKHHLYVCLDGILALRNQILFRDYLRSHKDAVDKYAKLKRDLAKHYEIDEYCHHKTGFITDILKKCGISNKEIDQIKNMNEI